MNQLKDAFRLLDELQSYLDMTDVPSEALDTLYADIMKAKQAINEELRNDN
jgi:hypothetical protein